MHANTTKNGYAFDEVASAFQKCIRRGMLDEALYWGVELHVSGREQFAWRRIMIVASEDVGLGDRGLPGDLRALYENYSETRENSSNPDNARLFFIHAILLLVTAPKSRLCDNAVNYHFGTHGQERRRVPDFALDLHTRRGRAIGRTHEHFLTEGAQVANPAEVDDTYRERVMQLHQHTASSNAQAEQAVAMQDAGVNDGFSNINAKRTLP